MNFFKKRSVTNKEYKDINTQTQDSRDGQKEQGEKLQSEEKETQQSHFFRIMSIVLSIVAVSFSLFHLYTAWDGMLTGMFKHKAVHLTFALVLIYMKSMTDGKRKKVYIFLDFILLIGALIAGIYIIEQDVSLSIRSGTVYISDIIIGIIMIITILEATRRVIGNALPIVALVMLGYCYVGPYLPSIIAHPGYDIKRISSYMLLNSDGIFGVPLQVSATVIILFILFGSFLEVSKGGHYFTELAYGFFGKVRGGPAKVAIAGSCLFGMVSGSAVANVVGTGVFTIPLMKKTGYTPVYAGAVEAVASTGGQIMPPIMGASAFLIAEILGVAYTEVMLAALIPALLYYLSLFVAVDLQAVKLGLKGLPANELPSISNTIKECWHIILAPIILIFLLVVVQFSPILSAFWSIVAVIVLSSFRANTRMSMRGLYKALYSGAMGALSVVVVCATAGIIIGCFSLSGLGIKLASVLISLSGGNLILLLLLTMISSLILGMGLPAVACYSVLAVLVAPALVTMGIDPMAAHMFIFYFGIISNITPPVAVAAYAAAGISGADPFKSGFKAFQLGAAGFIVPFMFVFGPELLFKGTAIDIVLAIISSVLGVIIIAMSFEGIILVRLNIFERIALAVAALTLLHVGLATDIIGYCIVGFILVNQLVKKKREGKLSEYQ